MKKRISFLRDVPFFVNLEQSELEKLAPLFSSRMYEKGNMIFHEGEDGDELFIIESGVVQIHRENESRDIILAMFSDGDFFGDMAILENKATRSASAKAVEKSTLYVLKRFDFEQLLTSTPSMTYKILMTIAERLRMANELISDLTILDARKRIIKGLLRLSETHGIQQSDGIWIDLKLTHQQLADMTGTARETVTKIMLELQNKQLVKVEKKKILLMNLDILEQYV